MDLKTDLTKRQKEIFDFIRRYDSTATRRRCARSARPSA